MDQAYADIKILVWDFDGTLYAITDRAKQDLRRAQYQVIQRHTGWEAERINKEFEAVYKKTIPSSTETTAFLAAVSTLTAVTEVESLFDRTPFVRQDARLVSLFDRLTAKGYRHVLFANSIDVSIRRYIPLLGLSLSVFEKVVTIDSVGTNKPNEDGFRAIVSYTRFPAPAHLMIGDQDEVDLAPARHVGMRTCLVAGDPKNAKSADSVVPAVYDIERLLL